ncbi:MAG: DUF4159 domain-containing protein [Gemmatimonadota bacterium]|jgi:hypothetical protein|nr:DUF4159 domain-containing protein [Gemmatimonadota bacterium]MDQ8173924.1 DUF4159 domain-containing protein [Gemmatimonadota bacterium]
MNALTRLLLCGGLCLTAWARPAAVQAQRRGQPAMQPNVPYDGRLTFVRVKYQMPEFGGGGFRGGRDLPWSHDYPRGERHFTKIVSELSSARVRVDASNILTLDDPQLGKYPIAYMAEAGFWRPSDAEALGLRNYLAKGGFIIFDDFAGEHWMNFETQMQKVLPKLRPIELALSHPIFDAFYRIKSLEYDHPMYRGYKSVFYGVFEDNDPTKRMLAIVNYNNDLSEYWEFSDTGMFPLDMSNEAYKLGVNYIIYALTR